jgi:hypothetical protein
VGIPADANTAPEPDPIAPFAPSTTILRMGLIVVIEQQFTDHAKIAKR